jgi:hypothetical protein
VPNANRLLAALTAALAVAACAGPALAPLSGAMLSDLTQRAEAARELSFAAPVEAWGVPPTSVSRLLRDELEAGWSEADLRRAEGLALALGLLPAGTDLRRALLAFQSEAVAGFYTPIGGQLYVVVEPGRPDSLSPADRTVVVHELVHALQAEHTRLLEVTLGLDDQDDLGFALGALLEGDALWASFRDRELHEAVSATPASDFAAEFELEWSAAPPSGVPRLIRDSFLLQYPSGYSLVEELLEQGGVAALDAAERDPPLSSEALLHTERYLDPSLRRPLALPVLEGAAVAPECRELARNTFGELGLRIWAQEAGVAATRAAGAADGWDGDRVLLLSCPAGEVFVWVIDFDSVVDAAEFERETGIVALGRDGLDVERNGARVLVSRGLSPEGLRVAWAAPVERFADLDAFLAARPEVLERARERRSGAGGR